MRCRTALLLSLLPLAAGCGGAAAGGSDGPSVVATTTQLADMARNIAPGAQVTAILAPNTDPHEYEVRPRRREGAGVAPTSCCARAARSTSGSTARSTARAWTSRTSSTRAPRPGSRATTRTGGRTRGAPRRPRSRSARRSRAPGCRTTRRPTCSGCRRSTRACRRAWTRCRPAQRQLVTSHDALGYYARRYGIEVVGTVIPALTTAAQPSAGEVAKLVDTIKRAGVKTIFAESSVNPKVEQAIAREAGARVGTALWADSLGPKGSDGATYIELDRVQHARAGRRLHRRCGRLPRRCLTSRRPTSSAGSSRSCCWR